MNYGFYYNYPARACASKDYYYDQCWCPYIYMDVYSVTKTVNGILEVDTPFQTLTVDFSSNL